MPPFLKPSTSSDFKLMCKDLVARDPKARVGSGMRGRRGKWFLGHHLVGLKPFLSSLNLKVSPVLCRKVPCNSSEEQRDSL